MEKITILNLLVKLIVCDNKIKRIYFYHFLNTSSKLLMLVSLFFVTSITTAQVNNENYLPPLTTANETPSEDTFNVTVLSPRDILITTLSVSNATPQVYMLTNDYNDVTILSCVNHKVNLSHDQASSLKVNKEKKASLLRGYPYPKEGISENLSVHIEGTNYNRFIRVTFKNLKDFNYAV